MRPSLLGLGTSKLASFSSLLSRAEGVSILRAAIETGISYIDTSNVYGQGRAEEWLGYCLKSGKPPSVRIATKAGLTTTAKASAASIAYPLLRVILLSRKNRAAQSRSEVVPNNTSGTISGCTANYQPETLQRSFSRSLRRLRVTAVDDFFLHEPPVQVFDRKLQQFLERLLSLGWCNRVGVCSNNPHVVSLAHQFEPVSVIQTNLSILDHQVSASNARISYVVNHVLATPSTQKSTIPARSSVKDRLMAALTADRFEVVLFGTTKMAHLLEATSLIKR